MGELGELAEHDADFKALDVQMLAINVDPVDKGQWVRDRLHVPFPILSDTKQAVMNLYGTRSPEYRNKLGISINTDTFLLIDKQGIIRWIHQDANFRVREPIAAILAAARKLP